MTSNVVTDFLWGYFQNYLKYICQYCTLRPKNITINKWHSTVKFIDNITAPYLHITHFRKKKLQWLDLHYWEGNVLQNTRFFSIHPVLVCRNFNWNPKYIICLKNLFVLKRERKVFRLFDGKLNAQSRTQYLVKSKKIKQKQIRSENLLLRKIWHLLPKFYFNFADFLRL